MDKDLDIKLYNDFLAGDTKAFEILYLKYKNKVQYFIYNIIKNNEKAEDITQEVFMYIFKNKLREKCSFKNYIYLVAKSRAINYLNKEKRRKEITDTYLSNKQEEIQEDATEIIEKMEERKQLIESINMLDEKYKNAIYLNKIEGFSYKETAKILNISIQNVKNLIHRGKKELRKILIKTGYNKMNKISKIIVIILALSLTLTGVVYAINKIYKNVNKNYDINMNPTYQSTLEENTINNIWVGTLDLAWKDLTEKIGRKIELEENVEIANELNESTFSKEMLDSKDYNINVEKTLSGGYKIDATLNKELNYLETFDNLSNNYNLTFGDGEEYIKYFGINNASIEDMNKNVEILFYNENTQKTSNNLITFSKSNDFAIKLKTKEGDEIILYRTDDNKSFDEYYKDILNKTKTYTGNKQFMEDDELRIPYVKVNGMISYNQLFGKTIKNTKGMYISDVTQNVNFYLNEKGCNLSSKSTMVTEYLGIGEDTKFCYFDNTFIIFMKEANCDNPYFALKVDNSNILEKKEETDKPSILDYTMMKDKDKYKVDNGEYKFYEDDKYEYYYPVKKTKYVHVYFKDGSSDTVEQALKDGKISLELLDEYGVEYIKKEK